jgi:hypothetical protein
VGANFSAAVQTVPGAHPPSYIRGTGPVPGVKQPGSGVDNLPSSSAEVEGRVELHIYSPSGPFWPVIGRTLPLPLQSGKIEMKVNINKGSGKKNLKTLRLSVR